MKITNRLKQAACLVVIAFAGTAVYAACTSGSKVQAEESGVSISPLVFELNADPETTVTNQVKIYNPTDDTMNVTMRMEDFTPVGEEGDVVLQNPGENTAYSIARWTEITPEQISLPPKEEQYVTFTIDVPYNAEPGGHYGSLVASISAPSTEVTGSAIETKRGALILLRASGNVEEEVEISKFETEKVHENLPVDFSLSFKNTGNVHVKPVGFITISDMFGNQVEQIAIPQNNVIPGAIRTANTSWEEDISIGYYTATVVANYGTANANSVTESITFFVLPLKQVLLLGVILIAVIILVFTARKRIKKAFKVLISKE